MTIANFLDKLINLIVNPLILLMFAVSFLYMVYGIFNFLRQDLNSIDKTRIESRNAILWGLAGMVIMFSVFGLIKFTLGTFGVVKGDIKSPEAQGYLGL